MNTSNRTYLRGWKIISGSGFICEARNNLTGRMANFSSFYMNFLRRPCYPGWASTSRTFYENESRAILEKRNKTLKAMVRCYCCTGRFARLALVFDCFQEGTSGSSSLLAGNHLVWLHDFVSLL
ncbi:hypothetical protein ACOSQ4_020379 [Xanthoceras sorbifolium]